MRNPVLPALMTLVLSACGVVPTPGLQTHAPPGVTLSLPASSFPVPSRFTFTATLGPAGAYLYVFVVEADGTVDQFLPDRYGAASADVLHPAGQIVTFPAPGAGYVIETTAPFGLTTLLAFVSTAPLNLSAVSAHEGQGAQAAFATVRLSGLEPLSAPLKAAAEGQPGTLFAETRAAFSITR